MDILIGKKGKAQGAQDALIAFVKSLDIHARDEVSLCSGVLDIVRAYMSERPCCIWRKSDSKIEKVSERGMVEIFYSEGSEDHRTALARALASGAPVFDSCQMSAIIPDFKSGFDGFLHVPIRSQDHVLGLFTISVSKKESKNIQMVQPLECLARLIGMTIQSNRDQEEIKTREMKLKAEVQATTRELSDTNTRLIDRVKELKLLYQELQKRVKELTEANRAKNEFLSIVSHELRTPLTSLTGFLCVLLDEEAGPINEQQKNFLTITKKSADRLNLLISDLLDVSRIESGRLNITLKPTSLSEILESSVEGMKMRAQEKGIELNYKGHPNLPDVMADESRIRQVVDNLISNAIKFTDKAGIITVISEEKGDFLKVSVVDTGIGLSKEEQEHVFDMFYQVDASTRRSAGGVGLGLAIARGIMSMHGGELWVESEKGHGSRFHFMVPRNKAQKAA